MQETNSDRLNEFQEIETSLRCCFNDVGSENFNLGPALCSHTKADFVLHALALCGNPAWP